MSGSGVQGAAGAADRFAAAHRALRSDPDIQFAMGTQPPPSKPPAWLKAFGDWLGEVLKPIGRALRWIGQFLPDAPYARILLWSVLALAAAGLVWMAVERVRHGEWRLPRRRRRTVPSVDAGPEEWAPAAGPVRAWLEEADALAAQGRYAEAVHHLLFRSVEDIGRRRPGTVRPALTSRELAAAPTIPAMARQLFAGIARLVERSLFGGAPVGADDWTQARAAYADFTLAGAWRHE